MKHTEDFRRASVTKLPFRWGLIALPLGLFALALVLVIIFYPRLPEQVAYHFQNGQPDRWLGRNAFVTWMLLPQALLGLFAFILMRVALLSSRYWAVEDSTLKKILPLMGNMVALPQVVLTFTMLDTFLYNAYQLKIIPVWVLVLVLVIIGGAAIAALFYRIIRQVHRQSETRKES